MGAGLGMPGLWKERPEARGKKRDRKGGLVGKEGLQGRSISDSSWMEREEGQPGARLPPSDIQSRPGKPLVPATFNRLGA